MVFPRHWQRASARCQFVLPEDKIKKTSSWFFRGIGSASLG
jgi:hypothetical protein